MSILYGLLIVVVSLLVGLVCAIIAYKKGKNPAKWFGVGAILSVLALLIINEIKKRKGGFP